MADYERKTFTVFVTKYWSTQGVFKKQVEDCFDSEKIVKSRDGAYSQYYHKPDWYLTEEEARAHVAQQKAKKLKSLQRQRDKLEKLDPFSKL